MSPITAAHPAVHPDGPLPGPVIEALRSGLRGEVVTPGDVAYDDARAVWNGMIDRRPGAIARCADAADVAAAVRIAREHGVLLAIRGGGHHVAGDAVCDGGLVIDLQRLDAVTVDTAARTVQAGGGVTIGGLDAATQPHGLAVPMGVVTETGIGGLTLSGGLGWLRRRHGLTIDNLLGADVVTADGRLVHASETSEPELFWALRGGGGNFGVVTRFTYRAHPVGPEVAFAVVVHGPQDTAAALAEFHRWASDAPDEISAFAVLWHVPELPEIPAAFHHRPGVIFVALHAGAPEVGEAALQPLRAIGRPIADLTERTSYLDVQRFFDEDYPAHVMRYYWKSLYLEGLPAAAIERLVVANEQSPSPHSTIDVWQLGGAVARVPADATAFGDRAAPYLLGIEANWEDPAHDEANLAWARALHADLQPYSTGGQYLNFPGFHEEGAGALGPSFGANLGRLQAAKAAYDPSNLFRCNTNIPPAPPPGG